VILIADDEIYIRELIKRSLAEKGHTFLEASDGNEATILLKENPVELLIIDMVMPHKGGIETLIELRGTDRFLKIIAITGKISTASDSVQGIAEQFKVDAVFQKPFDMFAFTQKVEELLS